MVGPKCDLQSVSSNTSQRIRVYEVPYRGRFGDVQGLLYMAMAGSTRVPLNAGNQSKKLIATQTEPVSFSPEHHGVSKTGRLV